MKRWMACLFGLAGLLNIPALSMAQERVDTLESVPVRAEHVPVVPDMEWQDTETQGQAFGQDSLTNDTMRMAPAAVSLPPLRQESVKKQASRWRSV